MNEETQSEIQPISWTPKWTKLEDLIDNPQNPKILTDVGVRRLNKSLAKYGLADTLTADLDYKLINGHSRKAYLLAQGIQEAWVSFPSRMLTEIEYKELNALFDLAKAGEPDTFMMENMFEDEFLNEWELKKPKKGKGEKDLYPIVPKFDEKYGAIIIICKTNSEISFIRDKLLLDQNSSYKNQHVGESFVTTADKFIKSWNAK